jgi:mRNA interferase MazF
VLSAAAYRAKLGLAVVCPIAGEATGYPFEVPVPPGLPVSGAVLADRVTSLGWRACGVRLVCTVPDEVVAGVQERLLPLVAEHRGRS